MSEQLFTRSVPLGAASFDASARTVEIVVSSETPVLRHGLRPDGRFGPWREVLPGRTADLTRARGRSVLTDHLPLISRRIGAIESAWVNGDGEVIARVKSARGRNSRG